MRKAQFGLKRLFDFVCSIVGVIILAPMFVIIATLIKLDSPGPVFFTQERLGKGGQPFFIIKFRTMVVNAENMGEGLRVSTERDPRITRIGRVLRVTSLDELPQLINIIKGEMSLVGPRPPVVYFPYDGYSSYPEWARTRFAVRPGLTGLAQVEVRNTAGWDERIQLDVAYVEEYSLLLDVKIVLKTIRRVFSRDGVYA